MDGVLVVYKEKGYTSADAVARLRRILNQKKIGHLGTLDPDAEGVLPICLGRATKLSDLLSVGHKIYRAVILLGVDTDTQDIGGTVLARSEVKCTTEEVKAAVMSFLGSSSQLTPMYSARKVDGQKLVDLARKGVTVERRSREITVNSLELLSVDLPRVTIRVDCSKGTYIRTLCHDIGEKLGCGAAMESLLREEASGFNIADSMTVSQIAAMQLTGQIGKILKTPEMLLSAYTRFDITSEEAEKPVRNGNPLKLGWGKTNKKLQSEETVSVFSGNGQLMGLYTFEPEKHRLFPKLMLLPEEAVPYGTADDRPSVVSIGKFDGFHVGHRAILDTMNRIAEEKNLRKVLFSFSMSPQAVLSGKQQENLLAPEEKRRLAKALGVDLLAEYPFTDEIRTMSAEDFLKDILLDKMKMKEIAAGPDCAFGYSRQGNIDFLRDHENEFGYHLTVVDKVRMHGDIVSSTRIRSLLEEGRIEEVNDLMGLPITILGKVLHGEAFGRTIGFPTINQAFPEGKLKPPFGVYASRVEWDGSYYPAITDFGVKPTVMADSAPALETHILHYTGDLYGKAVKTELLHFIRPEMRFESSDELKAQIACDLAEAERWHNEEAREK